MKQLVSVIIPVYNSEKYLSQCLYSIIHQTYENLEIIIVDDGSIDNSLSICNYYSSIDSRISVYAQCNGGPAVARRCGLDRATGDWVLFIDSDDYVCSTAIENMMSNCENVDVVSFGWNTVDYNNAILQSNRSLELSYGDNSDLLTKILKGNLENYLWSYLFKTKLIRPIFGHQCSYLLFEDAVFLQTLIRATDFRICYIPHCLYFYRQSKDSVTHNKKPAVAMSGLDAVNYLENLSIQDRLHRYWNDWIIYLLYLCYKLLPVSYRAQRQYIRKHVIDLTLGNHFLLHNIKLYLYSLIIICNL